MPPCATSRSLAYAEGRVGRDAAVAVAAAAVGAEHDLRDGDRHALTRLTSGSISQDRRYAAVDRLAYAPLSWMFITSGGSGDSRPGRSI